MRLKRRWRTRAAIIAAAAAISMPVFAEMKNWQRAGSIGSVQVKSGEIGVHASDAATAGAVTAPASIPAGADAVLVTATIARAAERSVTFSLQDDASGDTVAYWQNTVAFEGEQPVTAILPLESAVKSARLFAGTHRRPSHATIKDIDCRPVRGGATARGSIWGAWVDGTRGQSQTFVADGKLQAVRIRLRHYQPGQTSGGMRVRVYEWTGDIAASRRAQPIGEAVLPAELIPPGDEGNDRDISIAIEAPTKNGNTYLVSFVLASGDQKESLLIWAGPDDYEDGHRYENDTPSSDWDLYFTTYYAR